MSQEIDKTLEERGKNYGEFKDHAYISQSIKDVMKATTNWERLSMDKKECLEMVAHKIARILNGDPEYIDSWHDIIGYVRLVEKNIEEKQKLDSIPKQWSKESLDCIKDLGNKLTEFNVLKPFNSQQMDLFKGPNNEAK